MIFPRKIMFLTYGDYRFAKSRKRIIEEAKEINLFTHFKCEQEDIMNENEFVTAMKNESFKQAIKVEKGGGCYLWKPYVIMKNLMRLKNNDVLVYADAGSTIPNDEKTKEGFARCFEILAHSEKGILGSKNNHLESEYCKGDVFEYFKVYDRPEIYGTKKYQCSTHFVKKCKHSIEMYKKWWEIAKSNPHFFNNNIRSIKQNYPDYIRHVWDTGTWSLICKTMGVEDVEYLPIKVTRLRE